MDEQLIVGTVDAIFFENPTNLYKVIRIQVDDELTEIITGEECICTGQFATLHFDTTYEFYGHFTTHPKYGEQFAVTKYQQVAPTTQKGLVDYLSSDRFTGIGTVLAQRIVDALGIDAIDKIIESIDVLKPIKGLTKQRRISLRETLLKHQGTERVFMQLSEWGFSPTLADKIFQKYKSSAIEFISDNPYRLVEDIEGISFTRADSLAETLGFEPDNMMRLMAGIYAIVNSHCNSTGDTYLEEQQCLSKARAMLEQARPFLLADKLLMSALDKALLEKKLNRLAEGIMIPSLYYAELGIVEKLSKHLEYAAIDYFAEKEVVTAIQEVIELHDIAYDSQQQSALQLAINSPISIITGGPGTGKTTLVKGLIALHATLHNYQVEDAKNRFDFTPILLAAPTGRAAKRMNEMTGLPATTIHRLLGFNRDSNLEDFSAEKLEGKLLIVDEMSMVDTWLMNWLLQAVPYEMQVVFVGDKDQLPSVGPGKVFSDLIESRVLPTIQLEKIYRQGADSSIIALAHEIRHGNLPTNFLEKQADRSFIQCQPHQVLQVVQTIVEKAQLKNYDSSNLQVLAPMYKGTAGINHLNTQLQAIMNPAKKGKREIQHFDTIFRVGDKVLQLVNNAEEDVYNGDIGKIVAILDKSETESNVDELIVAFDDKELTYRRNMLEQLTLAYCCSIHKSQGSEYPLVIIPLVDMYSRMLRRDLLYTAVTRAKSSLVLVGNPNSFHKAATANVVERVTFLKELLMLKLKHLIKDVANDELVTEKIMMNSEVASISDTLVENIVYQLTEENIWQVDPMIGMENITPYTMM